MNIFKYIARARRGSRNKRGSIITEAAVMLPVYIIAVVTLIYITRICNTDIIVFSAVENQVRETSAQQLSLIYTETGKDIENAGLDSSGFSIYVVPDLLSGSSIDSLQRVYFEYETHIAVPAAFKESASVKNVLLMRTWTGYEIEGDAFGFDKMSEDENGSPVCVFPRSGGRYHDEDCRYVNSYAVEKTLDADIRRKYKPCPLCTEGDEQNGDTVYIFRYGSSYHNSECSSVDKYVIEMDKADAVIKDYTACSVCGGD